MKTCLIKPNGKIIPINYYNLLKTCEVITKNYCKENTSNLKEFENFSKDYQTYLPYIDFVIRKLGFVLLNPFLIPNTLYGKDGKIFKIGQNKSFTLPLLSDKEMHIQPLSIPLENSIVDKNGLVYKLSRNDRHPIYMLALLNYFLASNKELYLEYENFIQNQDLNTLVSTVRTFMYEYCGFSDISKYADESLVVMCNEKFLSDDNINLLKNEVKKQPTNFYEVIFPKKDKQK